MDILLPATDQPYWTPHGRGAYRRAVLRLLREPFSRRARLERLYSLISLPLAIAGFAFTVTTVTVGFGMSLSFAGMLVGLPLLIVSSLGARQLGAVNRGLAGRLLGLRVAPPTPTTAGCWPSFATWSPDTTGAFPGLRHDRPLAMDRRCHGT
jgi:hypothetical protein